MGVECVHVLNGVASWRAALWPPRVTLLLKVAGRGLFSLCHVGRFHPPSVCMCLAPVLIAVSHFPSL